ncbi:rhodanese-like domain-containing protein [Bacillus swezeyi]|uniref:rhodanese-like domain-containing protein n=1 Tax=Bacillus swezeyi TaxID=1925020 RepID=UPI003F89A998
METGKIPGAIHIPLGEILTRFNGLYKQKEYMMICRSGNRSSLASEWFIDKGFKVRNMAGGMMKWNSDINQKGNMEG